MEKSNIEELDLVALTKDISSAHLKKGDLGTVVLVYGNNEAFLVEFVLQTGFTAALTDVKADEVRRIGDSELKMEKYREWRPEWTDSWGYVPPITELPEWYAFRDRPCPDAHYLAYVDGTES